MKELASCLMPLLGLLFAGLVFKAVRPYQRVEIYQANWDMESERPLSATHVLRYHEDAYEWLENRATIDSLAALLENKPDAGSTELRDLRLVGLFHYASGTDTLLIDTHHNCSFRGKYFRLDSTLAQRLTVQALINPAYSSLLRQGKPLCVCHTRPETVAQASVRPAPAERVPPRKEAASYLLVEATDATTQHPLPYGVTLLLQAPASRRVTVLRLRGQRVAKLIGPVGLYTVRLAASCYDTVTLATGISLKNQQFYRLTAALRCSRR